MFRFPSHDPGGYYGEGGGKTLIVDKDNKPMHNLTITDKCKVENLTRKELFLKYNITETDAKPKHRYLYFLGTKKDVKFMKKDLLIKSSNYPKGDNIRYDNSYSPTIQTKLF